MPDFVISFLVRWLFGLVHPPAAALQIDWYDFDDFAMNCFPSICCVGRFFVYCHALYLLSSVQRFTSISSGIFGELMGWLP